MQNSDSIRKTGANAVPLEFNDNIPLLYKPTFAAYPPTRVKTYDEACKVKGIKPLTFDHFLFYPEDQREYYFIHHQIVTMVDVMNGGRKSDYQNPSERRYELYFWINDKVKGEPGFKVFIYKYAHSFTYVGSRLNFFDQETAEYAANILQDIFETFLKK